MVETNLNLSALQRHDQNPPDEASFSDFGMVEWRTSLRSTGWKPPTDVYETESAFVIRVEIAGMREEDFTVELDGRLLTIRGFRSDPPERRAYQQMEIRFGEFSLEFSLPSPIASCEVHASYQAGFLRVVLPKVQPRQVPVDL